jgi:hypothetical protein
MATDPTARKGSGVATPAFAGKTIGVLITSAGAGGNIGDRHISFAAPASDEKAKAPDRSRAFFKMRIAK